MSGIVLGIDIGTNSIGWALLDEGHQAIIDMGVRIFPEGVDRDQKGGEVSKNENRRVKRGQRRQIMRRAKRKHSIGKILRQYGLMPTDVEEWKDALHVDPYPLRKKALDEPLSIYDLGRTLYHLSQHRGFKSNRKSSKEQKKESSKMLQEISGLEATIREGGYRTLGEYLATLHEDDRRKVRGHHTRREMYEEEYRLIWNSQRRFFPEILTDELFEKVKDVLFFQRPMYWKKSALGKCELEPKEYRCPRADRVAQRFRLYQEVNNLKLLDSHTGEERVLAQEERTVLIEKLLKTREAKFEQILKWLHLPDYCQFNLERGKRTSMKGMETDAILSNAKIFGKRWFSIPETLRDEIVILLLDDQTDDSALKSRAVEEWGLSPEEAEHLLDANLPEGYARHSRKAIVKLLPYVEQGFLLMSNDETPSAMSLAGYLRPDQRSVRIDSFLPKPPDLPNPIVRQALIEFRKLVNAILREHKAYGTPEKIYIELAREVKGSISQREEISRKNRDRERIRNEARKEIEKWGHKATREAINRYLLWKEQQESCVYTGQVISPLQLFGGEVDVDHILPFSRSLDDSLANKIVCFRAVNAEKGDQTPYEWLAERDPGRYEQVLQRVRKITHYGKRKKFSLRNVELNDFIKRQLSDTQYISRELVRYVQCLGVKDVLCTKGQNTSELRHVWGLNTVLNQNGQNVKNREDHRHHAVDAVVIALTDRSRLQQLARSRLNPACRVDMPMPWEGFRKDVEDRVKCIFVSHRVKRRISGALHEETIYGPTSKPGVYSYRKPLEQLTPNMIDEIRDPTIRSLVRERLQQHGISGECAIPAVVWKEPLTMPSGVPIKKVRLQKKDSTIQTIRGGTACVKPGSNHHLCLFEYTDEKGKVIQDAVFVTMLEAVRRIKNHEPIIQRTHPNSPNAKFLGSLSKNEAVLIQEDGKEELYLYDTAASTSKQMKFVHHTCSKTKESEKIKGMVITKKPSTLHAKKVTVDMLGRIRNAND